MAPSKFCILFQWKLGLFFSFPSFLEIQSGEIQDPCWCWALHATSLNKNQCRWNYFWSASLTEDGIILSWNVNPKPFQHMLQYVSIFFNQSGFVFVFLFLFLKGVFVYLCFVVFFWRVSCRTNSFKWSLHSFRNIHLGKKLYYWTYVLWATFVHNFVSIMFRSVGIFFFCTFLSWKIA